MDRRKLARIHRVRTLQLGLAQADETRAREAEASEAALSRRIAQLAAAVPAAGGTAVSLAASAHYRERLHRSATAAADRVRAAQARADHAAAQTREAKRDQSAVEKLLDRATLDALRREMRALEDAPATKRRTA